MAGPDATAPFSHPTVAGLAITIGKRFVEDREGLWAMWGARPALETCEPPHTHTTGPPPPPRPFTAIAWA